MKSMGKTVINKSIIEEYFTGGITCSHPVYINLISKDERTCLPNIFKRKESQTRNKFYDQKDEEFIEIEINISGISQKLKQKIQIIHDLTQVEIIPWLNTFEEVCSTNEWNDEQINLILRNLIKDPDLKNGIIADQYIQTRNNLIKKCFPFENNLKILKELENILQINYSLFSEFLKDLKKKLHEYAVTTDLSKKEIERKRYEVLNRNLGFNTKLKLIEKAFKTPSEIENYLLNLEKHLLVQLEENTGYIQDFDYKYKSIERKNNFSLDNSGKYCPIHKSNNHSKLECNVYKRKNLERKNLTKKSNFNKEEKRNLIMIEEEIFDIEVAKVKLKVEGRLHEAIVDSGASKNFISINLIKDNKLDLKETPPLIVKFGNGEKIEVNSKVEFYFTLGENRKKFFSEFYVLNRSGAEIIIGADFLIRNGCSIDFENFKFKADGICVELIKNKNNEQCIADKNLIEKLNSCCIEENKQVEKLVEEFKNAQENFEHILVDPIKIKFNSLNIVQNKIKNYWIDSMNEKLIKEELIRLQKSEIIIQGRADYISPGFIVKKKNNEIRLVIDFRDLNKYIIDEQITLPLIFENLQKLGQYIYFTKLDLKNGFNQLRLEEESQKMAGSIILDKIYYYKRLPFGIKIGPKYFQLTIQEVLNDDTKCFVYIDDIVVFGKTQKEHDDNLMYVLEKLFKYNVRVNWEKSIIRTKEIEFLGYRIRNLEIKILFSNNLHKILKLIPRNKKELQRILGIINWHRRFIKDASLKIIPISDLLRKERKFVWTSEHTKLLDKISTEIQESCTLITPDFNKLFFLETDASELGCGGALYQESGIIGHYSNKFNSVELNYSICEKEMLALLKSLNFFHSIIKGQKIIIRIDNKNNTFLKFDYSKRINRWRILLNEYDYIIEHLEGKKNTISDTLSRLNLIKEENEFLKNAECLKDGNNYVLQDCGCKKIVIPSSTAKEFLKKFHNEFGHLGILKSFKSLNNFFQIKKLRKRLEEIAKECKTCLLNKPIVGRKNAKVQIYARENFSKICSDVYGPFYRKYSKEKGYLITLTDVKTRFTKIYYIKNNNSEQLIKSVKSWINNYGYPETIVSDNGKNYSSKKFMQFCNQNKIKNIFIPPYTPKSNGISEKVNQTINFLLRINKDTSIKAVIKKIERRLNQTFNVGIMGIPAMLAGMKCELNVLSNIPCAEVKKDDEWKPQTGYVNLIGKMAYVPTENTGKLEPLFKGPYTITKVGRKYQWIKVEGSKMWFHVNKIKVVEAG